LGEKRLVGFLESSKYAGSMPFSPCITSTREPKCSPIWTYLNCSRTEYHLYRAGRTI
jgi:hypothetical protein